MACVRRIVPVVSAWAALGLLLSGCPGSPDPQPEALAVRLSGLRLGASAEAATFGYSIECTGCEPGREVREVRLGYVESGPAASYKSSVLTAREAGSGLATGRMAGTVPVGSRAWTLTGAVSGGLELLAWDPYSEQPFRPSIELSGGSPSARLFPVSPSGPIDLAVSHPDGLVITTLSQSGETLGTATVPIRDAAFPVIAYSGNRKVVAAVRRGDDCDDAQATPEVKGCQGGAVMDVLDGVSTQLGRFDGVPHAVWTDGRAFKILSKLPDCVAAITTSQGVVNGPRTPDDACSAMAFDSKGNAYLMVATPTEVTVSGNVSGSLRTVLSLPREPGGLAIGEGQCALSVVDVPASGTASGATRLHLAWMDAGDEGQLSAILHVSADMAEAGSEASRVLKTRHDTVKNSIGNIR